MKFMCKHTTLSGLGCPLEHGQFMIVEKDPDTQKKVKQKVSHYNNRTLELATSWTVISE